MNLDEIISRIRVRYDNGSCVSTWNGIPVIGIRMNSTVFAEGIQSSEFGSLIVLSELPKLHIGFLMVKINKKHVFICALDCHHPEDKYFLESLSQNKFFYLVSCGDFNEVSMSTVFSVDNISPLYDGLKIAWKNVWRRSDFEAALSAFVSPFKDLGQMWNVMCNAVKETTKKEEEEEADNG